MSLRRGLALIMTVVASATVMTSVVASPATARPMTSSGTICVALVVDGRALGSDVSTACATVHKGATGVQVLEAAGHTLAFRHDGLLCTIDGLPKTGCAGIDDSHYWAYYHRAPGATSWTYSTEGASTYQPANASTEGWVYDNGTELTPKNVPYASICKTTKPTSSPTPTTPTTPKTSASAKPTPTTVAATATRSSTGTTPQAGTASPTPATHKSHRPASPTPTPRSSSATPTTASPSPSPSASSVALAGAVAPASSSHGLRNTLVGLVLVAVLAAFAVVRFRRPRR